MRLPFTRFARKGGRRQEEFSQETTRDSLNDRPRPSQATVPAPIVPPSLRNRDAQDVRLPLSVLLASIPGECRGDGFPSDDGDREIELPGVEILSQLARGEVTLSLRTLADRLPPGCLRDPLPPDGAEKIRLPLEEIVPRIPPEWLDLRADQESVDTPEEIPPLFAENPEDAAGTEDAAREESMSAWRDRLEEPATEEPATEEPATEEPATEEPATEEPGPASGAPSGEIPPEDAEREAASSEAGTSAEPEESGSFEPVLGHEGEAEEPSAIESPEPIDPADIPETLAVPLARLLDSIPEGVVDREAAAREPDRMLELRTEWILPQLARGEIVLVLPRVIEAVPDHLLLPEASDQPIQPVTVPLDTVVSQLPPGVFALSAEQIDLLAGVRIPELFRETSEEDVAEPPRIAEADMPPPEALEAAPPEPATVADDAPAPVEAPDTIPSPEPVAEEAPRREIPPMPPIEGEPPRWVPEIGRVEGGRLVDGFDVNRCTESDLCDLPGIGPALARRIVEFREERGGIDDLYDLLQVPGIGKKLFRSITGLSPSGSGVPVEIELSRLLGLPADRSPRLREVGAACERLPGCEAVAFASRDGLVITGRAGEGLDLEQVAAAAPLLLRRMTRYTREVHWGRLQAFSILAEPKSLTVFPSRNLLLLVGHEPGALSAETMERLQAVVDAASRSCSRRLVLEEHGPWR